MSLKNNYTTNDILAIAEYNHWWFQSRRAIMEYIFWKKLTKKDLKILSVGCDTGAELEHLSYFGRVTGIDIDPEAILFCRLKGFEVIQSDVLASNLKKESFDIIVAMDVIEHIQDDVKAISALKNLLKKDGKLLITVPALPCLWSSFDEEGDYPHFRRYTKKTLTNLFRMQNLIIEKISYYNFFLFPLALIARLSNQSFASQMNSSNKFKNTLLRSIFSFEKYFLSWMSFPTGVSLVAVCRK